MNCTLCLLELSGTAVKEKIKKKDLIDLYKGSVSIDITKYLSGVEFVEFVVCPDCGLQCFHPSVTASTEFYEKISRNSWYYTTDKAEFNYCADLVNSRHQSLLEIGAGEGNFAVKLKKEIHYTGLEYNEEGRKKAKIKGINLQNLSIDEFASENLGKFDSVAFFQVLEHVENPHDFIKAALSVVKKGGYLYLSVPSSESFYKSFTNHTLDLPPHHVSRWSDRTLAQIATVFNLELESIYHEPLQSIHMRLYLLIRIQSMFSLDQRLVRTDLLYRGVNVLSRLITKLVYPVFMVFMSPKLKTGAIGAHVTAIYKKK